MPFLIALPPSGHSCTWRCLLCFSIFSLDPSVLVLPMESPHVAASRWTDQPLPFLNLHSMPFLIKYLSNGQDYSFLHHTHGSGRKLQIYKIGPPGRPSTREIALTQACPCFFRSKYSCPTGRWMGRCSISGRAACVFLLHCTEGTHTLCIHDIHGPRLVHQHSWRHCQGWVAAAHSSHDTYKEEGTGSPADPAVKALHFQCRASGFDPWSGS